MPGMLPRLHLKKIVLGVAPAADLLVTPGAGSLPVEERPQAFNEHLLRFLAD